MNAVLSDCHIANGELPAKPFHLPEEGASCLSSLEHPQNRCFSNPEEVDWAALLFFKIELAGDGERSPPHQARLASGSSSM